MTRHLRILEFALANVGRARAKHAAIVAVYSFVVFVLASMLLFSQSLKREAALLFENAPDVIVQRMSAGRHAWIPLSYGEAIARIRGVANVSPRFWGYYYDPPARATYTVLGVRSMPQEIESVVHGGFPRADERWGCLVGEGIAQRRLLDPGDIIPVKGADGKLHVLRVRGIFRSASQLLTNDLVVIQVADWQELFHVSAGVATDMVVRVPNGNEIETVIRKVREQLPDARPISREQILRTYDALFDWRSGVMILVFAGALAAFAILAWDSATGLNADERRMIGVLKATGWEVGHVLELKFWEGACLSAVSFLGGVIAAHVHVFHFGGSLLAPMLKGWSVLFPTFELVPHAEGFLIAVAFFLSVVPYMLTTLIPSWKAAITDPEVVMRS